MYGGDVKRTAVEPSLLDLTLEQIIELLQSDRLDRLNSMEPLSGRLVIWDLFGGSRWIPGSSLAHLPKLLQPFEFSAILSDVLKALWFLGKGSKETCIVVEGGFRFGILACVLNSVLTTNKRKILLFDAFMPDNRSWGKQFSQPVNRIRRWLARRMILGSSVTVVFSRRQIEVQAAFLDVPTNRFLFVPYKSNHSQRPPISLENGNYVFSGGNSRRDYRTLFEAVRGTNIPVIVSATDRRVYGHLDIPENVILVNAGEPAFGRLIAASRFVVISLLPNLVRGAGEGSVCDAMWHSRPVICADDISAFEYIQDGVDGYVVAAGDVTALRERIVELWNDPEKAAQMGRRAYQTVSGFCTHQHFVRRLRALGSIVAARG